MLFSEGLRVTYSPADSLQSTYVVTHLPALDVIANNFGGVTVQCR